MRCLSAVFLFVIAAAPCTAAEPTDDNQLAPLPDQVPAPADNPTTPEKVELGRKLFFDPRLSGDNTMSCATCHLPDRAYGDGLAVSPGANGRPLQRNTQSCLNVAYFETLFWDGRANSLEEQALGPIQSALEMNQPLEQLEAELAAVPGYVTLFRDVFDTAPERSGIAKSLAAFQRTLVTQPSPFDRYVAGEKDALSAEAKEGLALFQGDAGCVECHNGPLLSDGGYYRLGVSFRDEGRAAITGRKEDRFRFRTPSLRNIAETGPYMHDGSLKTLDEVVTFYYRGIPDVGPDGLRPDTSALRSRSFSEIDAIVAFLKSLTGKAPDITPPELP
ncbi:MAG: cytochrome c peroxidase [Planctomycetaceae bacterium]